MRKDVNILINSKTSQVMLNQRRLGLNYENLQGKIIVTFDDNFVDGIAYLEIERNGEKGYLLMTKENEAYTLEIKSSLLNVAGQINMQVRITESEQDLEIPVWKSNVFYLMVEKAINSTTEIPDEYPSWIDTANAKLQEIDNLNIEAEKVGHTTTVTITGKDGSENSVEINDGEAGEQGPAGPAGPVGPAGRDGAIQYTAGDNITIENNVISADFDSDQYYTKNETNNLLATKQDALPIYFVKARSSNTVIEFSYSSAALVLNSADVPQFVNIVKDMLAKDKTSAVLMYTSYYGKEYEPYTLTITGTIAEGTGKLQFRKIYNSNMSYYQYGFNNDGHRVSFFTLPITYSNDDITGFGQSTYTQMYDTYLSVRNNYEYTPTNNYHPATKKYVDDAISSIPTGGSPIPVKYLNNNGTDFQTNNINGTIDSTDLTNLINAANEVLTDGFETFMLLVNDNNSWHSGNLCYLVKISSSNWNLLNFKCIGAGRSGDKIDSVGSMMNTFYIAGTRSGDTITALDNYVGGGGGGGFILYTDNINAYTPTSDYQPATKKYVDDNVSSGPTIDEVQILSLSSSIMNGLASMQRASLTTSANKAILLKLINDTISAGKTSTYFINRLDDYFTIFRMIIPSETTGTQTVRLYMEPNPSKLTELKYGEIYWIAKTMNVTYTDNVATDLSIPSSGYTQQEWKYLRFGNTNSFTPTRDYEPATKKYVDDAIATAIANLNN